MENEVIARIQNVKETCRKLDKDLHNLYDEMKGNGSEAYILNELRDDMKKVHEVFYEVNSSNLEKEEVVISVIEDDLVKKYGAKAFGKEVIVEEAEQVETKKSHCGAKAVAAGLAGGVLGGLVTYSLLNKDKWNVGIGVNNEATVQDDLVQTYDANGNLIEVEAINLLPGEYGTFLDVNDDEQVMARAEYIYNTYYAKFINNLCQADREIISVNEIANTIRVVNGHLPLDENGNRYMDSNVTDYYMNRFIDFVGKIPSCDQMGTIEYVPGYLFAEDGSKMSEFIKSYDDLYRNIANARNNRDGQELRKNVQVIAAKYWTEWFLQGMGGNIIINNDNGELFYSSEVPEGNYSVYRVYNPYGLEEFKKYPAYCATMYRYDTFIYEAEHNQMATVCIPACVNYSSKEMEDLSIDQIYTAIDTGVWNDIIARSAGMEVPKEPVAWGFWQSLDDQLMFEYEHSNNLALK